MLMQGKTYRFSGRSTYDIYITKIFYSDKTRLKLKYMFVDKNTGQPISDTVFKGQIMLTNIKEWKLV